MLIPDEEPDVPVVELATPVVLVELEAVVAEELVAPEDEVDEPDVTVAAAKAAK